MKFSVLLPTRNRLEYLKYAVETVRRQDYDDWEVIISDNCSEEDIKGYVQSLGDARIKYFRTDEFIPVTDNWNNALENSSGDYIIMLGDDDCLMKGYFRTVYDLINEYQQPDFIYTSAFLYVYPGVYAGSPDGYLQPYGYASFLKLVSNEKPYLLDKPQALELVKQFMNFRVLYGFNMQFSIISRKFISSLKDKGPFFQSPFPDYYATNVMFLKAERILICPYPLVTIGVTPKSYGFYHFNNREAEGIEFLKTLPDPQSALKLQRVLLPGSNINTSWLFSIEAIKANYGAEFDIQANYRRYRLLQISHVFEQYYATKSMSKEDMDAFWKRMRLSEKITYGTGLLTLLTLKRLVSQGRREWLYKKLKSGLKQFPEWDAEKNERNYNNILDVFEQVNPLQATH
ncbi:MAG TPA: glycosyltransferase [Pyrinomonadaceae bacterium]|nr:glycosyltransferase [Pyrinomonadaceae bacterium]